MRNLGSLMFLAAALAAGGCRKHDPIAHYKVPKEPTWRILGAMVPVGGQTWFFKAVGPARSLAEHKEEFIRFLDSVKFVEGKPQWTLPEGWREEKGPGERLATLRFGRSEPLLELAVSSLPGEAGGVPANVDRWRGQLGLQKSEEGGHSGEAYLRDVGGEGRLQAMVVDFEGPMKPQAAPVASEKIPTHAQAPEESRSEPVAYELPPGWARSPGAGRLEFQAGGARVSFTVMEGEAGGLVANINRWRGQVGLGPVDEEGARRLVQAAVLLDREAASVELTTSEKAIFCVFLLGADGSVFVKMDGPVGAVERQKRPFWDFVRSLKLNRKNG